MGAVQPAWPRYGASLRRKRKRTTSGSAFPRGERAHFGREPFDKDGRKYCDGEERKFVEAFDVPVPQIQEEIAKVFQFPPQERTSERIVEQIMDVSVPVPQIQEQILDVANGSVERVKQRTEELNVNVPWEVIQLIPQVRISEDLTEQIDDLRAPQKQFEESITESSQSRADKLSKTTATNDFKATLDSSITDTKSELQPTQLYATEEKNSQERYKEFMSESLESCVFMTTSLNDSKGTPVSNITDTTLPERVQSIEKNVEVLDDRLHAVETSIFYFDEGPGIRLDGQRDAAMPGTYCRTDCRCANASNSGRDRRGGFGPT